MTHQDNWKSQLTITGRMADPVYIQDLLGLSASDSWMPDTHMVNGSLLPHGACIFLPVSVNEGDDGLLHLQYWFDTLHPRKEGLSLLKTQGLMVFLECWMEGRYLINLELSPARVADIGSLFSKLSELDIEIDLRFEIKG